VAAAYLKHTYVVLEERIGWVVAPNDVDGLAAAIETAAGHPKEDLVAMGARARDAAVSQYSKLPVIEAYTRLMNELEMQGA